MGRFYNGVHYSYQSNLGPNERFGIENDDDFQKLALKLEQDKLKKNRSSYIDTFEIKNK